MSSTRGVGCRRPLSQAGFFCPAAAVLSPLRGCFEVLAHPRLTPWAVFFGRSAAANRGRHLRPPCAAAICGRHVPLPSAAAMCSCHLRLPCANYHPGLPCAAIRGRHARLQSAAAIDAIKRVLRLIFRSRCRRPKLATVAEFGGFPQEFGRLRAKGSAQRKSFPLRGNSYSITKGLGLAFSAS